ncbi:MAG: MCP four helix bundle domain-containing protein, partial [Clostridiales Family XIII bacterium]|nr:MCP four helix bundle domain-containing protein [Clostridiales Family XIII bacterium]
MKIKTKLLTGFIIMVVLTAAVGCVGVYSLTTSSTNTQLLNNRATMAIMSARLSRNIHQQRAAYLGIVAFDEIGDYDTADSYPESLKSLAVDFEAMADDLDEMLTLAETRQMLEKVMTEYAAYATLRDNLVSDMEGIVASRDSISAAAAGGSGTSAAESLRQKVRGDLLEVAAAAGTVVQDNATMTDYIDALTNTQAEGAAGISERATWISIGAVIAAAVIAIILGLYLAGIISKPVNIMMGLLKQVGETGKLSFTEDERSKA